jgi:hypothetical protein
MRLHTLLSQIWSAQELGGFDALLLANTMYADGGHDFTGTGVTARDLVAFMHDDCTKPHIGLEFAMPEVLSHYIANEESSPEKIASAFFAILGTATLCKAGRIDWGVQFDKIINCFAIYSPGLHLSLKMDIAKYLVDCMAEPK